MRCTTDYSMNARRTTKSFKARIGLAVGVGNQIQTGDEMTTELETRLREIEEWEKAATPGPWTPLLKSKGLTGVHATDCKIYHAEFDPGCLKDTHDRQKRDAEFIAHARGDIPFLVEQVRRLQAENDETSRALLNTRKLASTTAATMKADIDKLSDWRERVIKYHGYLTGVITEAEAGE